MTGKTFCEKVFQSDSTGSMHNLLGYKLLFQSSSWEAITSGVITRYAPLLGLFGG